MFDAVGKRLLITVVSLVAGFLGSMFLTPEQAKEFLDYALAVVATYVGSQTVSDSVKAWKAPESKRADAAAEAVK